MRPYALYENFTGVGDAAIRRALDGQRTDLDRRIAQELVDLAERDPAAAQDVWWTSADRFRDDPHMPDGILVYVGQTLHA